MVIRVAIVVALLAAAMVAVRQGQVLQNAGLVGYCKRVVTPRGQTGVWHECVPGKLTGTPGLSLESCTRVRRTPAGELWRCPTPLATNTARQ